ncbi:MAG: 2-phospho-L-lactate transferase [Candidatus Ranarchaeia archaeon]
MSVVVLAGGVGAAKFLRGLIEVLPQEEITIIGNTGDDDWFHGLYVAPDLDIVTYTLAGIVNEAMGWGIQGDTFNTLNSLKRFGVDTWFNLGDQDLATHIYRTMRLHEGAQLDQVTKEITRAFGLGVTLIPMSNQKVTTMINTNQGVLRFEEYFVKHRFKPTPLDIFYDGIDKSKPAPGIIERIDDAEAIIFAPSNPVVSINTILSVPKIKQAIQRSSAVKIAISPIVAGKALKGPADRLLTFSGYDASAMGIANFYKGLIDHLIIDNLDAALAKDICSHNINVYVTNTIMNTLENKIAVARATLKQAGVT